MENLPGKTALAKISTLMLVKMGGRIKHICRMVSPVGACGNAELTDIINRIYVAQRWGKYSFRMTHGLGRNLLCARRNKIVLVRTLAVE